MIARSVCDTIEKNVHRCVYHRMERITYGSAAPIILSGHVIT